MYRARDTRLGREVAIKVSSGRYSERLELEARAIASLNHPNIATLHDVGDYQGSLYLAMEYVKGAPLKGPYPIKEAIDYGIQIARGMAAAHDAGVVHRDLKPANINLQRRVLQPGGRGGSLQHQRRDVRLGLGGGHVQQLE